jgi:hypothetical protein
LLRASIRQWAGLLLPVLTFQLFLFSLGDEPLDSNQPQLPDSLLAWLLTYWLICGLSFWLYASGVVDALQTPVPRWHKVLAIAPPLAAGLVFLAFWKW